MLLFQWGVFDWRQGSSFEYDITRQCIFSEPRENKKDFWEEDVIWQLSLTLSYSVVNALQMLSPGDRWCDRPSTLDDFVVFIEECEATQLLEGKRAESARLEFGPV